VRPHIVSIPNGNIPLGDEEVVFWLTYISWRWKNDVSTNTYLLRGISGVSINTYLLVVNR
jgi:hypothetical protein